MCGIFASTDAPRWHSRIDAVLETLSRRGPDASGSCVVDGLLFAQTRLSIIGLGEAGRQPAHSVDGQLSLVFNGEIYNYKEMARALGYEAMSSDTQLLAEVLRTDPSLVGQLRGMFAFVAWDSESRVLYAARDHFGIKPLYALHHDDGGMSFASQLAPLLLDSDARVVDQLGLGTYLAFGHTGPGLTCFEAVRELQPGTLHSWRREGRRLERFAVAFDYPEPKTSCLADALSDSVEAHLVADVEVGTYLSGGVDSTILTYLATRAHGAIRSFTVGFPDQPDRDESALAAHNAGLIRAKHTIVPATDADLAAAARTFLLEHGEPFGDAAMLPLTHLSLTAGKELRVVLCGEGADELFGGYGRYRITARASKLRWAPVLRRRALADWWGLRRGSRPWARGVEALLAGGGFRGHAALLDGDLPLIGALNGEVGRDVEALTSSGWATSADDELGRARHYDTYTWLSHVYMVKTDRATMAGSLEARVPFLDREVAAAAARQPISPSEPKRELRELLHQWVPGVRLPGRKQGLSMNLGAFVERHYPDQVKRQLNDPGSALRRWMRTDNVLAANRATRSPSFAFRLAMLDEWQCIFGEGLTWPDN
jgi:asparagine synthase (glutamine-hydrolysing)